MYLMERERPTGFRADGTCPYFGKLDYIELRNVFSDVAL